MGDSLYERIQILKEEESQIKHCNEVLEKTGYAEYKVPVRDVGEVARNIVEEMKQHNTYAGTMAYGVSVMDHVNSFLNSRSWKLRFNKEKRESYNDYVEDFKEIIPSASRLRVQPWYLSWPTITAAFTTVFAATGYVSDKLIMNSEHIYTTIIGSALGAFLGFLIGTTIDPEKSTIREELEEQATHIDNILLPKKVE